MTSTYSSSYLRDRDKGIHDKYQNEIRILEAKIEKQRRNLDEHLKTAFDVRNSGERLARSLGFNNVFDAQVAIDSLDYSFTLKDTLDRLDEAEAEITTQKKEKEIIQDKLTSVEEKYKKIEHENNRLLKEKAYVFYSFVDNIV